MKKSYFLFAIEQLNTFVKQIRVHRMTPTSLQTWTSHALFGILIKFLKGLSRFLTRHTLAFALLGTRTQQQQEFLLAMGV